MDDFDTLAALHAALSPATQAALVAAARGAGAMPDCGVLGQRLQALGWVGADGALSATGQAELPRLLAQIAVARMDRRIGESMDRTLDPGWRGV